MGNVPPLTEKSSSRRKIWVQNYPELRQYLQFDAISAFLVQNKLLTQDQLHEFVYTPSPLAKVDKLLLCIPRSRPDFLEIFIDCLKLSADGTNHKYLANKLERAMADAHLPVRRVHTVSPLQARDTEVEKDQGQGGHVYDGDTGESSSSESEDDNLIHTTEQEHSDTSQRSQTWWKKNWQLKFFLTAGVAVVCGALLIGAFLGASVGPGVHDYNIGIHRNDTIVVPIRPSSRIVHKLDLQTDPTNEASCNSLALLLPCDRLHKRYTPHVSPDFFTDQTKFFYMLSGSSVNFFFKHEQQDDIKVWVFNDYNTYIEARLDELECNKASAPKGSQCLPLSPSSPTINITITNTSYYFFTCSPSGSCLGNLDWTIDLYWYDYNDYLQTAALYNISSIHRTEIVVQKKRFDIKDFNHEIDICLLLYVKYNRNGHSQTCSTLHTTLYVRGITINQGVWLFAALSIPIVVVLVSVYLCCCCYHHRKQKRTGREQHLRLERTI